VLSLTALRAVPGVITPNADGIDDHATVSYTLGTAATVTATLAHADGRELATLFSEHRPAGANTFAFTADGVPDGSYTIVLRARGANGREVAGRVTVVVSRTLASYSLARPIFSPNGDGRLDTLELRVALAAPATVRIRILTKAGLWVATPLLPVRLEAGLHAPAWDGSKRVGRLPDGEYRAELTVTDEVATVTQVLPFVSDTRPPVLRLVSTRPLRLTVNEPAEVVVVLNGQRTVIDRPAAGEFTVPVRGALRTLRANAWDRAGNISPPVRWPR
jgi:hypothetical protein